MSNAAAAMLISGLVERPGEGGKGEGGSDGKPLVVQPRVHG